MSPRAALLRSALVGAATGGRTFTGLAVLSATAHGGREPDRTLATPVVRGVTALLAAGELAADKLPQTPSRLAAAGLVGRIGCAAVCGVIVAQRETPPTPRAMRTSVAACVAVALAGAAGAASLGVRWRTGAEPGTREAWLRALAEDATAIGAAALAARGDGMTGLDTALGGEDAQWSLLGRLNAALRVGESDLQATLDAIVRTSVALVDPARHASVNLMVRGRFSPQASHGQPPDDLDVLQAALGDGPCIAASNTQQPVHVPDLRTDTRWPAYTALGRSLGVLSMLCVPLRVDEQRVGSLSLYAEVPEAFTDRDEMLAGLLALQCALALLDAQRTANLRQVAVNRDLIGMAKGLLMERHHVDADQAFAVLSRASQRSNRKVVDVARCLVDTGELP